MGKTLVIGETLHLYVVSGHVRYAKELDIFFSALVLADTPEYAKEIMYKKIAHEKRTAPTDITALALPESTLMNVLHYAEWKQSGE